MFSTHPTSSSPSRMNSNGSVSPLKSSRKFPKDMFIKPRSVSPMKSMIGKRGITDVHHANLHSSCAVRALKTLEGMNKEVPDSTAGRSFLTVHHLREYLGGNDYKRREDFGCLEHDIEVHDQIHSAEGPGVPNGATRVVIVSPQTCITLGRTRGGKHEAIVTPSRWVSKLCIEGAFHLCWRTGNKLSQAEYLGLYVLTSNQDGLQPVDWSLVPSNQSTAVKELWDQQHESQDPLSQNLTAFDYTQLSSLLLLNKGFDHNLNDAMNRFVIDNPRPPRDILLESVGEKALKHRGPRTTTENSPFKKPWSTKTSTRIATPKTPRRYQPY